MRAWERARDLAERTPEARNRYVDLLRAVSIAAVVFGHWLIAAPWVDQGHLRLDHMLGLQPWTQWLTWLFQVMPIFFMVGGYSNAASWEAARRSGRDYGVWVGARLRRLIAPIVPLLLFWGVLGFVAHRAGVTPPIIKIGSQAALVPIWFLAIYVLVVVLAPVTHWAWRRFGIGSFWALVALAVLVDLARFRVGLVWFGWTNYLFVWSAVHHMGYMWKDGRLTGPTRTLAWMFGGLFLLLGLVFVGGYPLSMVGVPGEEVSNTLPPSLAMLGLGMAQGGLLLTLEAAARRWLRRATAWAATILVNGMIMSVYLWHLTAMVLVIGLLNLIGGFGLGLQPGSDVWWATRPVWMVGLAAALFPFLLVFVRFERLSEPKTPVRLSLWRALVGSAMVCVSLALISLDGIGAEGPLGVRVWVLLLALLGAALVGVGPRRRDAAT
jgi:fucose 4-O-acetylase-like acetyltransferase